MTFCKTEAAHTTVSRAPINASLSKYRKHDNNDTSSKSLYGRLCALHASLRLVLTKTTHPAMMTEAKKSLLSSPKPAEEGEAEPGMSRTTRISVSCKTLEMETRHGRSREKWKIKAGKKMFKCDFLFSIHAA